MAHNGSIKPMAPLDALLEPGIAATLRGTTDSERYFALIRQHRRTAPTLAEAVRRAVSELRDRYPEASLNALLLGEGQLVAVHAHARSRLPAEDIEEITAADLPTEHLEDYFALRWARPTTAPWSSGRRASATSTGSHCPRVRHGGVDRRSVDDPAPARSVTD